MTKIFVKRSNFKKGKKNAEKKYAQSTYQEGLQKLE